MSNKFNFEKILSEIENKDLNVTLTKRLVLESRIDSVIRQLVKDVIRLLKRGEEGFFELPVDLYEDEMTYHFKQFGNEFTLELNLKFENKVGGFEIDGNFYEEEDVLEINILINPSKLTQNLQKLIGVLNELIAHELTHFRQIQRGDENPQKKHTNNLEYYLQKHELEAQYAGFKRRARKEKRSIESVMDEWFEENKRIHQLKPKEIKILKNAILNWEFY